jgi:hypothetical protein
VYPLPWQLFEHVDARHRILEHAAPSLSDPTAVYAQFPDGITL